MPPGRQIQNSNFPHVEKIPRVTLKIQKFSFFHEWSISTRLVISITIYINNDFSFFSLHNVQINIYDRRRMEEKKD